ncbi:hypothetical protein O181_103824 [Austropuccinia psidii MF-1]|uniref:Uncharacterized protein n=1 Tax=Austropuccinia psidii MF-1 TaxID=1389203 RepID=A0A9Q3PJK9_9BASI|nr:hypothetical protein [Austropuccinia psidii MF-1]
MNQNGHSPSSKSQQNSSIKNILDPMIVTELQKNLSQKDHLISHLLERVQAMELQIQNKTSTETLKTPKVDSSTKEIRGNQYKESIQESQSRRTSKTSRGSFLNKRKTLKAQALQKMHDKQTKKSPLQMITKDYPAGFENTKVS